MSGVYSTPLYPGGIPNKKPELLINRTSGGLCIEQMTGIEPASPAWEAGVLPMNYICNCRCDEDYYTL